VAYYPRVPRTDLLLADPRLAAAEQRLGRGIVKAAIARAQQQARDGSVAADRAAVADQAVRELPATAASLTRVINATGVIVHTNLGRAPLSPAAIDAIARAAGPCDVEFDLAAGARGQRGAGALAALRSRVPPAQAAGVVNNNAAALVLAATALTSAEQDEIVISRGELIEIGDRFRLPDLLESTGARLREVGTTNRTTAADYEAAIAGRTAFILKVHPSNYRVEGFTASAAVADLARLGVPVVHDIGSGLLAPHPALPAEPDATTSLSAGASLVTASGDKLLGGPQAGIILGAESLVRRLLRHPLARALRVDKLTLAALEATLAGPLAPVPQALSAGVPALFSRAERVLASVAAAAPAPGSPPGAGEATLAAQVVASEAAVGGGGAPGVTIPSAAISVPAALAGPLRWSEPVRAGEVAAVVGRVDHGRLLLDLRSVDPADDDALAAAIRVAAVQAAPVQVAAPAAKGG
jgi:L-seryl-tRNA(Ser) seleniumtransferase